MHNDSKILTIDHVCHYEKLLWTVSQSYTYWLSDVTLLTMASVDVALMKLSEALENLTVIGDVLVKKEKKNRLLPAVEWKNLPLK